MGSVELTSALLQSARRPKPRNTNVEPTLKRRKMNIRFNCCAILAFVITIFCESRQSRPAADNIEASVVKLLVTKREPDYFKPWTKAAPEKASGSGVVIEGKRILTNAHVVMHASQVFVQMRRGGDQLNAKVKAIGPGIDLAIVELTDPEQLKDVPAVPLADELAGAEIARERVRLSGGRRRSFDHGRDRLAD